jgi:hypothetical protein
MENSPMIIAPCGLICSDCDAYKATQAGDAEELARIAIQWNEQYHLDLKADDLWCDGCLVGGARINAHACECGIRSCVLKKGIANCASCSDYSCETASGFFKMVPDAKKTLDSLREGA